MQATIADLKEQVDTCLGAQQMVDILTTKNLSLEDQVRELQESVDNLVRHFSRRILRFTVSSRNHSVIWTKVTDLSITPLTSFDSSPEMEENAKEIEQDLRENIDLLQSQMREVRLSFTLSFLTHFDLNRKNARWNNCSTPSAITSERF